MKRHTKSRDEINTQAPGAKKRGDVIPVSENWYHAPGFFLRRHLSIRGKRRRLAGAGTDFSSETLLSAGADVLAAHRTLYGHQLAALTRRRGLGTVI